MTDMTSEEAVRELDRRVAAGNVGLAFHRPYAYANCPRAAGSFVI
jgi:hypothetical protein